MEIHISQKSDKIRKIKDASILIGLVCLGVFLHIYHNYKFQAFKSPFEPASKSHQQNKAPQNLPQKQENTASSHLDESTNAAAGYKKAISMLVPLPKDFQEKATDIINNGLGKDSEELKDILTKNKDAIREFKKAAKLPNCDFSIGLSQEDTELIIIPFTGYPDLAKLVTIEGKLYENEGDLNAALENYVSVSKFIIHITQQKGDKQLGSLYEKIIWRSIYTPLCQYINHKKINTKQCSLLLDTLISLKKNLTDFESVCKQTKETHMQMFSEAIQEAADELKKHNYYDPAFYQQFYLEYDKLNDEFYRHLITAYRQNEPEKGTQTIKQLKERLQKETKSSSLVWNFTKARLGLEATNSAVLSARIVFAEQPTLLSSRINWTTFHYEVISELNVLTTAVAIRLYELENGNPPPNLEALTANYLSELPEDPFDEFKPLKYKRENDKQWLVYSLGPDKKDNNGSTRYDRGSSDKTGDIVLASSN
jgi:hypothetical protein